MPAVFQRQHLEWLIFSLTRYPLVWRSAQIALGCVLLFANAARADPPAQAMRTMQAASACVGACSAPQLVQIDDRRVVVLWRGDDHTLYAQGVDVLAGSTLGTPADLGKLLVAGPRDNRAIQAAPLLSGDLALFGALRDGRITFARGSTETARRVPSKAILKGSELVVLSLAVAALPQGFALLVLRGADADTGKKREMQVELHRLGPTGESSSAPLIWTAPRGNSARLGQCGEQLYAAWLGPEGLVSTTLSETGDRSPDSVYRYGKQSPYATSSVVCSGSQAYILTSWFNRAIHLGASNKLSIARLDATASKPTWKDLKLPGQPVAIADSDGLLELGVRNRLVQLPLEGKTGRVMIEIDLTTGKLGKTSAVSAQTGSCLALRSGAATVCAQKNNQRDANGCWRSDPVGLSVHATTFESPKDKAPCPLYWAKAQIERPDAPSPLARPQALERVQCGEPDWEPLRKALIAFCAEQARLPKSKQEEYLSAYCGAEASALEAQARSCQLPRSTCPGAAKLLPSVERAEYDKGWVGFWQDNCTVWFTREGGVWRVVDGECQGD